MTRSVKRALDAVDYRARSPKRRKVHAHTYEPEPERADHGVWSVRAILKQRKKGNKTQYLLDWDPDPDTGEHYEPTWVCTIVRGERTKPIDMILGTRETRC
jgi:hypothetical protein